MNLANLAPNKVYNPNDIVYVQAIDCLTLTTQWGIFYIEMS